MSYNSNSINPASGADSTQAQEQVVKSFSSSSPNLNNVEVDEAFDIEDYKSDYREGNPAVFVCTYHKLNCGRSLDGEWLDITKFADYDEFMAVCRFLHRDEADPEFAYLDYENFCSSWYCESSLDERTFDLIKEFAELDEDEREAFEVYVAAFGSSKDDWRIFDNFREAYQGKWDSEKDFTYNLVDELGMLHNVPQFVSDYFDFERFSRALFESDYYFESGFVFRNL